MLDDASFYTFAPSLQNSDAVSNDRPRRKTAVFASQSQSPGASLNASSAQTPLDARSRETMAPPKATLARRAQSYTDFHRAAKAVLRAPHDSLPKASPIKDELQFVEWYESIEDGLLEAGQSEFNNYLEELSVTKSYLGRISQETTAMLDLLADLSTSFNTVTNRTTAFQKQCEDLLLEQRRLEGLADNVGQNLQYYSFLEPITRKLNAPGAGAFVRGKEFSDMLARLDECLEYMNSHPTQREAATYRSKYRLLLTRGLTLIKVHFVSALKDINTDVSKRIADKQLNDTTMSALLYAKFRVGAAELKEVAQEIHRRAIVPESTEQGAEAEYQGLMNELYAAYASTRGRLVLPLIQKRINEIALAPSSSKDLVIFARTSVGYIKGMCADEFELWKEWFEGNDGLDDFLETICDPLYDHLKPRIIHETQIVKLCELCTLLQTRYFSDPEDELEVVDPSKLDFGNLILPMLEDTQTRLVFRAQNILRNDIENFKPKLEDVTQTSKSKSHSVTLSGPALSGRRKSSITEGLPKDPVIVEDGEGGKYDFSQDSSSQGWYPTLRKAIWLLSRIYRLVNSTVFDDLAHQIVHQTTLSLQRASVFLSSSKTPMDGQLFLMKHLLLLKQQIVAFDIEYVSPDITFDFSGMASTFYELRERGGIFDPRALWRLLSNPGASLLPRVVENMLDAKVELDGQLRTTINDFCASCSGRMTVAIAPQSLEKKGFDGSKAVSEIQSAVKKEAPLLRSKLEEYLDDSRTRETLVGAVQDQVVLTFETWAESTATSKKQSKRPTTSTNKDQTHEPGAPDVAAFTDWVLDIFRVGRGFGAVQEEDEEASMESISDQASLTTP